MFVTGVLIVGCSNNDTYDSNYAAKQYQTGFEKVFGAIDASQDWKMVSQRTAKIAVNNGTNETYTVGVYKNDPLFNSSNCGLLAQGKVTDGNSVTLAFDSPTAQTKYYVGLFDSKGRSIAQLDSLDNNVLTTTFGGTIARSAKSTTRVSANEQSTSTAYSDYLKTETDFDIPEFSSSYYDISLIPSESSITLDATEYLAINNYKMFIIKIVCVM